MPLISQTEREKYDLMWGVDQYREFSPGQKWIPTFLELAGPVTPSLEPPTLVDLGCGTGRAGATLAKEGYQVTLCDLSASALDVDSLPFISQPLWTLQGSWDVGFCCDVMEHIPREFTMLTLDRILRSCRQAFFTIALEPDVFGTRIGQTLHLTVEPFVWWRDHLRELGTVLDARDCLSVGIFWVEGHAD